MSYILKKKKKPLSRRRRENGEGKANSTNYSIHRTDGQPPLTIYFECSHCLKRARKFLQKKRFVVKVLRAAEREFYLEIFGDADKARSLLQARGFRGGGV